MAQVPTYKPSVAERPALQASITTRASSDDMGAAIGRGMQSVGQGLGQAADVAGQLRDLEDQMRAKEADNAFATWNREAMYGENGYMTLQGQAAIDGRSAYEKTLEEKRMEFGSGLTGGASQMYSNASKARVSSSLDSSVVHAANERKSWFNDTANARLDTFAEDALSVWNNPAKVDMNIAGGQAELRQQGAMLGWSPDVLANREAQYISDVRKNIALRHMSDDPIKAEAYIKDHKSELTGQAQFELDEALKVPLANAQGLSAAAEFMGTGTRSYGTDNQGQGPTNARSYLMANSVNPRQSHVDGLDGSFANNLAALMQDSPFPGLGLLSGNRTQEEQIKLFEASDKTGHSVAFPVGYNKPDGSISNGSNHQHGNAVDISYNGRSLKHAPKEVQDWVHANGGKYGINFPMSWEPWHAENGARSTAVAATGMTVPRANMPSRGDMETYLAGIADPRARQVARTAIMAQMQSAASDAEAQRKQIGQQAFSEMVTQNVSPFSFAPEVQSALGIENMNSLTSYWEKMASGEKIVTNDALLYEMQKAYAADPVEFAKQDLLQYRSQLSDADWKSATGWQQIALTDQRKAGEDGIKLNAAFSAATTALEAAGITTTDKKDEERVAAAKQIAQFNNMLAQQMEAFKQQNERAPNEVEIQSMTNKLLLPVVIKPTQVDDGFFGNHFFGIGLPGDTKGFMFEVPNRPDGTAAVPAVPYAEIPLDLRNTIRTSLTTDLGRDPTEEEIAAEYATFFLSN